MMKKYIRWPEVEAKGVPISQCQAERNAQQDYFPRWRKFGGPKSTKYWDEAEIDEYLRNPEAFAAKLKAAPSEA